MRSRIVIPVLLGLSLVSLPAMADRWHHSGYARDGYGRPDPPGHAIERARPTDDMPAMTARRAPAMNHVMDRTIGRPSTPSRAALPSGRVSLYMNTSTHKACNEAGECFMSNGGVKAAIFRASQSRATGIAGFGKINNARGKSLLGRAAGKEKTSFNEAGEPQGMSKFDAQAVIAKAAHSRANGIGTLAKINNAKGKSMLGRAAPSERMACNEAEECSMNNSGAKAEWQKAEARRHRN